jgi:hypothetical protein
MLSSPSSKCIICLAQLWQHTFILKEVQYLLEYSISPKKRHHYKQVKNINTDCTDMYYLTVLLIYNTQNITFIILLSLPQLPCFSKFLLQKMCTSMTWNIYTKQCTKNEQCLLQDTHWIPSLFLINTLFENFVECILLEAHLNIIFMNSFKIQQHKWTHKWQITWNSFERPCKNRLTILLRHFFVPIHNC